MPIGQRDQQRDERSRQPDLERGTSAVEEPDQLVAAERPVRAEDEQRRLPVGRADQAAVVVDLHGLRDRHVRPRPGGPQVRVRRVGERVDAVVTRRIASRRRRRRGRRGGSRRGRPARRSTSGRAAAGATPTATGRADAPGRPLPARSSSGSGAYRHDSVEQHVRPALTRFAALWIAGPSDPPYPANACNGLRGTTPPARRRRG